MVQFASEDFSGSDGHSDSSLSFLNIEKYIQFLLMENEFLFTSIKEMFNKYLKNIGLKDHQIIDCSGLPHVHVGTGLHLPS